MARSMLSSFSNLIVQYLTCNGAPRNWHDNFSLVLKSMIVKSEYVENAKYNESYYSARDNANDGWNAAFEIFPGDGDFPDYL
ncbi:hypothetical protein [Dyadobacter frigoris]|uniref:hypothetical protein n=1 Tax=Dyadobacter frigoris TaxID=2576211 RepID=UPI002554ACD0|nr:hypothetical protein [Dyadobacter frigoris]